jgi:hypothetical protein
LKKARSFSPTYLHTQVPTNPQANQLKYQSAQKINWSGLLLLCMDTQHAHNPQQHKLHNHTATADWAAAAPLPPPKGGESHMQTPRHAVCNLATGRPSTLPAAVLLSIAPSAHHASMRSGVAASGSTGVSVALLDATACAGHEKVQPFPLTHCTVARARPRKVPGCVQCFQISLHATTRHQQHAPTRHSVRTSHAHAHAAEPANILEPCTCS